MADDKPLNQRIEEMPDLITVLLNAKIEECAVVAEKIGNDINADEMTFRTARDIAIAIRALKEGE
jgi:hypothetical protein